jgi:hypothetical protein
MGKRRLDLYPGDKLLVVTSPSGQVSTAVAWGGPATEQPAGPHEPFGAGPTDPGEYVILGVEPHHVTQKWPFSRIPWGAPLKVSSTDPNDVLWEEGHGRWRSLNALLGKPNATAIVAGMHQRLYGPRKVPPTWVFNDFGPRAVRYFVDSNKNGVWDKGEEIKGEMFHTTPDNEAEEAVFREGHPGSTADPPVGMFESHGCIHMRPTEFGRLIGAGAFTRGTRLTVHKYSEHFQP